ncbi:hypothetical protein [Mesobacillus zeae]|uniref:Oxalate:formate antiporter n=1 Tax=Mesobacillus zeae TaxID=1917180 RepID=A0A398B2U2_9BACI|nr:hypothetical protein [Mesobacillus zeae]RID84249.1 hypothetical protein D1970_13210 [Mesobacillus zeae]
MRKSQPFNGDLLYVHLNERDQYVLSCGIEFIEFARSLADSMANILLLKHNFEDGEYNRHTMLQYVPQERIGKLVADDVRTYGDFCWMDFEEVEGLNVLTGHEIAEILYLGHIKHHLKLPFYNQLGNRFVYLAQEDGWFNKIYYRNLNDFFRVLSEAIPGKLAELRPEKSLFGIRKKRLYPPINKEILKSLSPVLKEGAVFSFKNIGQNRNRMEIPIWAVGDFSNMDDMYEEFLQALGSPFAGKLIFDKKLKEWSLLAQ